MSGIESPFASGAAFVSVVGFAGCTETCVPQAHCRRVRRQRSMLSEKMNSMRESPLSMGSGVSQDCRDDLSTSTDSWSEDLQLDADEATFSAYDSEEPGMQMTQPRAIPYTR
jgi:hypothetical protein